MFLASSCVVFLALFALLTDVGGSSTADMLSPSYDEHEARLYLQYARASFCTKDHILEWNCGSMCEAAPIAAPGLVRFLGPGSRYGVQGLVAVMPGSGPCHCVVAFRGSAIATNWLADAETWQTAWPPPRAAQPGGASWCEGCRVHHGFSAAYEELQEEMITALKALKCRNAGIAGHSLGAGIAALAALELRAAHGFGVQPVFLFGAPRVGNSALALAFDSSAATQGVTPSSWRIVHYRDPLPRLPPARLDYRHVSREVYYSTERETEFKVCTAGLEDPLCSGSTPLWKCIDFDHLTYLNLTLSHARFGEDCVGETPAVLHV
eukprot:TRINITY_DN43561_c0_g1_i1.p1 TRINITY_DN43561_c0_g1~~TRINITY_DN43561_c0_g1_i1.p1  ORF type:complete len:330 (-),score=53.63 TRINITY_DN43561_c0_g1_i1:68-1033(-)